MGTVKALAAFASAHPAAAAVIAAVALAAAWMAWRAARRAASAAGKALRGQQAEDVLTVAAAGLATAVAMTGMWRFFGTVLHFSGAERAAMFAFLELAVVTSAFRARRNMRWFGSAGAEGIAVWVLSGLSAVFAAMDASSAAEAVFRLAPPLVAAWLWHRALSLERRRSSGRVVHWRLTAERVLVWLGLAEPSARAAGEVDAHRRIARLARAAKRLRERRAAGAAGWRQERARRRLDKAMEAAVEHAGLASDPGRQDQMRDQIAALNAAEALASLAAQAPWDRRAAEAAEVSQARRQAQEQVRAAERDRDQAVAAARQEAGDRARAADREVTRAREDAARITGAAAAQVRVLEHSRTGLQARAEAAERELEAARKRTSSLTDALARAESRAETPAPEAGRDALVAELAGGIRTAAADGDKWRPDYEDLMARTGRQRRWCEYVVRDARSAVFGPGPEPARDPAPRPAREPARAEPGAGSRAGQLASANGHPPGGLQEN
jgi:hypothetical protein